MVRKKSKPRESMFLGNSEDLKKYLTRKKKSLQEILTENKDNFSFEEQEKVKGYINLIDRMLKLKYFKSKIYTMPELIEKIKSERAKLSEVLKELEDEEEKLKNLLYESFKNAGSYMANSYEEETYNSPEQESLREAKIEYEACAWDKMNLEQELKLLWRLLGVIKAPVGFFKNAV